MDSSSDCTFNATGGTYEFKYEISTKKLSVYYAQPKSKILLGDVNGDSKIDTKDTLLVLKYSVHLVELSDQQLEIADVTNDGNVTIKDALKLLKYIVGSITEL